MRRPSIKAKACALRSVVLLLFAAALAGTVSGIDNCCFVDRQCHSDQQWTDGFYAFQNNQCSAPAQTQPASGAPAQVDNCCFIDRQCNTDQDWINGYWAYQNNQCSAPQQSPAPASSQPAGGAPAQIDNCCYVDRQCNTDLEWRIGWHAYRTNQCGAAGRSQAAASSQPGSVAIMHTAAGVLVGYPLTVAQADIRRRNLRIDGSPKLIAKVNASLDLLKARSPYWYAYTAGAFDWFVEVEPLEIINTTGTRFVQLVSPTPLDWGTIEFTSYLIHYACHNYQAEAAWQAGVVDLRPLILERERECLTREIEAMEVYSPNDSRLIGMRHTLANIDKCEYQWWYRWWDPDKETCD